MSKLFWTDSTEKRDDSFVGQSLTRSISLWDQRLSSDLTTLPPSTIFGFGVAGTSTAQERTRSLKEALVALFYGGGTIGSPAAFRGEAPWSRISIPVPHVAGESSTEAER